MRLAVLLCGVLSGVIALGFGWWGQQGLLFNTTHLSQVAYILVVLAIHIVALTSIAGGMAVLVSVPVSRIALLSSAVGWLLIIAIIGGGITLPVGGLIILSAAGGLAAFLPSVQSPAFRIERPGRSVPMAAVYVPPPSVQGPSPAEIEVARVRAAALAEEEDHSRPFLAFDPNEDNSRPFGSVDTPASRPAPRIDERRQPSGASYDFRTGAVPKPKRKRRPQRQALTAIIVIVLVVLVGAPILYLVDAQLRIPGEVLPATVVSSSSLAVAPLPERSASAAQASSNDGEPDRLPSQPTGLTPSSLTETASADEDSFSLGDSSLVAAAELSGPSSSASAEPVAAAALPPLPSDASFASPFDYCTAFGNSDAPDVKKITGGLTELIFNARKKANLSQGDVRWRCMDKAVWTCVQSPGGLACDKVPDSVDRVLICASHPDAQGIRTAAGDWSCDGFTPVVSQAQLSAPDRRGFDKNVWQKVAPPVLETPSG